MTKKKPKKKTKIKQQLTTAQKRAKAEWKRNHEMIFINGKQKWIKKSPTIDGLPENEFLRRNADPLWLHQNGLWELIPTEDTDFAAQPAGTMDVIADEDEIPF